jgi:ABC-2 type transport system ATP-binding protein
MLSKNLSTDHSLVARVVGEENEIAAVLNSVLGVQSVTCLGRHERGSFDFQIVPEEGMDIRAAVSSRLAERKKPLLSLAANELTLEQIFLRLTDGTQEIAIKPEENAVRVKLEEDGTVTEVNEEKEENE